MSIAGDHLAELELLRKSLTDFCIAFENRGETTSLQEWNKRLKSACDNAREVLAGRLPFSAPIQAKRRGDADEGSSLF